jgi:hypothetical protein
VAVVLALALLALLATPLVGRAEAMSSVAARGAATVTTYAADSATTLRVSIPSTAQPGDVLVATLGFGTSKSSTTPVLTMPAGWTQVIRTDHGVTGALAIYVHVAAAGDAAPVWTANIAVGGVAFVTAFSGVDTDHPIDAAAGTDVPKGGKAIAAPSVSTVTPNAGLVAGYIGYRGKKATTVWNAPTGMAELGDAGDAGGNWTGTLDWTTQPAAGATGKKTASASQPQDYAVATLIALRSAPGSPPPPPTTGAVPIIVDTDMFSDADDVGALATAFGLQLRGEASVIAIGVNTRTSRPSVATNSWKCTAAIANFYGFGSVPIGTDMPNNGSSVNTTDFIGPCATLAPASTPTPDTAVNVYRRALASQADGTVVLVGVGYEENLSSLLNSPADAISSLSGRDLVARKVKSLVVMGGGYPSRTGETNLSGNPAAAQNVASNWPTKIVWSGYEVGDAVHTGNTISAVHPQNSPVRVAYEAFVGPNNWIYSYDLTAVYHAIRPDDALLREVGPGTNVIDSNGGNTFVSGSGNQYYLRLADATSLDGAIETLLDVLPSGNSSDTTPPAISAITAGSITSTSATVSWTTDESADGQVDYGVSTAYGSSTTLNAVRTTTHAETITGLSPGTLYHYRVRSRDATGNVATSGDSTFTTATSSPSTGPNDTFDGNSIDTTRWIVTSDGSTVSAANQELEIRHPGGVWTKGAISSASPHDQRGRSLQLQVKRAANDGLGGAAYGETSFFLSLDATHYVEFYVAGGSLTAWVNSGSGEVNLTPSWPSYNVAAMQWLRFRESAGTLSLEYASGTTAPGAWTTLASLADPFALSSVTTKIVAGSNVATDDVAAFDNVSTY